MLNQIANALSRDRMPEQTGIKAIQIAAGLPSDRWYRKKLEEVSTLPDLYPDSKIKNGKLFNN